MRILQFCNYADRVGGAEIYAQGLTAALRECGHDVALFGASPKGEVDRPGLRVIQRPPYDPLRLVTDPPARNALREYIARFRPDVLHVHNLFSVALDLIYELANSNIPVVHTVHDFQLLCPNSWCVRGNGEACPGGAGEQCFRYGCERNYPYDSWSVLLSALRQQLATRMATIAVAPSLYLVERLQAHGWQHVELLPYFVDFPHTDPATARSDHALLYVGRLEPEKGVNVLLDALALIRPQAPSTQLTIVGSGSQETNLRRQVSRLRLGRLVRFLTHVPRLQIATHYARNSACVLPSVWTENSPLVAYECLQSGLPMIGSALGGIPELIGDCGLTCTPRDHRSLAHTILEFFKLPISERQLLSARCRMRSQAYGKPKHMQRLEQLYSSARSLPNRPTASWPWIEMLPLLDAIGRSPVGMKSTSGTFDRLQSLARYLGLPKIRR